MARRAGRGGMPSRQDRKTRGGGDGGRECAPQSGSYRAGKLKVFEKSVRDVTVLQGMGKLVAPIADHRPPALAVGMRCGGGETNEQLAPLLRRRIAFFFV